MTNKANPPIAALSNLGLPQPLLTFLNQLWVRTGGGRDAISDIEVTQISEYTGNRSPRRFQDEIADLEGRLVAYKRENSAIRQQLSELEEQVNQGKKRNRLLEQKINELIERYDSGA